MESPAESCPFVERDSVGGHTPMCLPHYCSNCTLGLGMSDPVHVCRKGSVMAASKA